VLPTRQEGTGIPGLPVIFGHLSLDEISRSWRFLKIADDDFNHPQHYFETPKVM